MRRYFSIFTTLTASFPMKGNGAFTLDAMQDEAARALAARDEVRATDGNGLTRDLAIEFRDDNGAVMRVKFTFQIERLQ